MKNIKKGAELLTEPLLFDKLRLLFVRLRARVELFSKSAPSRQQAPPDKSNFKQNGADSNESAPFFVSVKIWAKLKNKNTVILAKASVSFTS